LKKKIKKRQQANVPDGGTITNSEKPLTAKKNVASLN
jgi:hypothetical protein